MTREELNASLAKSRAGFLQTIEGLTAEEILEPGVAAAWSVRDVMQHLSIWEAETIQLMIHYRRGHRPPSERFRISPGALDAKWHEATRHRPLDRVVEDFHGVRRHLVRHIDELTFLELNRMPAQSWMQKRPLAEWIARDTYLHEQEHTGQIRRWRGAKREAPGQSKALPTGASSMGGDHD
ncbi:MAG: DinB family protein [Anaerolineales bacterium]